MKQNPVAVVIGHGPMKDTGATSYEGESNELVYNRGVADRMLQLAPKGELYRFVVIHREKEGQPPWNKVNELNCCAAIELHCNASDGSACGAEVIHAGTPKGIRLAGYCYDTFMDIFPALSTMRGIKTPWKGRGAGFLNNTHCPAIIAEPFFIDNKHDWQLMQSQESRRMLALAYLSVVNWAFEQFNS